MEQRSPELAMAIATTDLHILLEEIKDLKINLSLELQAAQDDRRAQEREFREYMAHLWETLRTIQARFHVDAQLLNLVGPHKAGEKKWQERNSSHSRMLDRFAKRGS
jgi:hypothetical protein